MTHEAIKAVKELINERDARYQERFDAQQHALELQAKEYSRRLDTLNHAHERAEAIQRTYVTLEKFESFTNLSSLAIDNAVKLIDQKSELLATNAEKLFNRNAERISMLEIWRSKLTGVGIVLGVMAGTFGGLLVKVFKL